MKHVLPFLVLFLAGCPDPSLQTAYEPFPWKGLVLLVAVILAWYLGRDWVRQTFGKTRDDD
jgi:hypothetical protein